MDWQDRLKDAGTQAIGEALRAGLATLSGPIIGEVPPNSNPTAAQVEAGQRAQPQQATILQRPDTEGTKNGLVQFFSDSFSNNGVMIAVAAVAVAVVAAIFIRRR